MTPNHQTATLTPTSLTAFTPTASSALAYGAERRPLRAGPVKRCPSCRTPLDGGPVRFRCHPCGLPVMAADLDTEYHPTAHIETGTGTEVNAA